MPYRKSAHIRIDSFLSIILLIAFFVGLFFILKGIFWVLSWVAPVLLVAAFIIDRFVVINYGKWLVDTVKKNPLVGIAAMIFTVIGYMVVFPFLFAKALFKKKVKDVQKRYETERQGELIDYEEIESKPNAEVFDLPKLEKRERHSEYDKFFD
jgi:hypothetical protein